MKKKIINGIMMVALVAATSTSFVSCKDTNEDVQAELQAEYANLYGRLQTLENYDLNGRVKDLETKVANHAGDIAELQAEVDALELWILTAFSNLIYTPQIAGTYNNLTGEIDIPGINPMMLFSYYGTAAEDGLFPEDASLLKEGEVSLVWNSGDKLGQGEFAYVSSHLYAAINRYVDTTPMLAKSQNEEAGLFDFSLVQTDGTEAPVTIENFDDNGDPTSDVLNWGWTRAESNVYKFDVSFTGDDAESYKHTIDLKNLKQDIKTIFKNLNGKDKKALGKAFADLYYNYLAKGTNLPKYALKISWDDPTEYIKTKVDNDNDEYIVNNPESAKDGVITVAETTQEENAASFKVTSNYDILFATVKPLGFKSGEALGENAGKITNGINKTFEALESIENKIFNKIKAQLPNLSDDQIKTIIAGDNLKHEGNQWYVMSGGNKVDLTDIIDPLNESLENVKDMLASAQKLVDKLNGKTVTNWVEKFTNKFDKFIANNANQILQPTLLALNDGAVNRVSGLKSAPSVFAGEVVLEPTSYNAEFIAPAYAKIVSCKDIDADGFNEMIYVNDKELKFTPESGKTYEITYTAVDFLGNIFLHKYYIQGK